jgi:hypothetical protein
MKVERLFLLQGNHCDNFVIDDSLDVDDVTVVVVPDVVDVVVVAALVVTEMVDDDVLDEVVVIAIPDLIAKHWLLLIVGGSVGVVVDSLALVVVAALEVDDVIQQNGRPNPHSGQRIESLQK